MMLILVTLLLGVTTSALNVLVEGETPPEPDDLILDGADLRRLSPDECQAQNNQLFNDFFNKSFANVVKTASKPGKHGGTWLNGAVADGRFGKADELTLYCQETGGMNVDAFKNLTSRVWCDGQYDGIEGLHPQWSLHWGPPCSWVPALDPNYVSSSNITIICGCKHKNMNDIKGDVVSTDDKS